MLDPLAVSAALEWLVKVVGIEGVAISGVGLTLLMAVWHGWKLVHIARALAGWVKIMLVVLFVLAVLVITRVIPTVRFGRLFGFFGWLIDLLMGVLPI